MLPAIKEKKQNAMINLEQQNDLLESLKKAKTKLARYKGIRDVSVGYKFQDGKMTDELSIIVYVFSKYNETDIEEGQILPKEIEGLPLDVIESNPVEHPIANPFEIQNPLIGGISISNTRFRNSGTLAAIVYDKESGKPLGLTNHHVLIGSGNVFRRAGRKGDRINQPAFKPDSSRYNIGKLWKGNKHLDCSVFTILSRSIETNNSLNGIVGSVKGETYPLIGMPVKKTGARTGLTYGIISAVSSNAERFTVSSNSRKPAPKNEISRPGDSGSLWVTDTPDNLAVGLHWGGDPENTPRSEVAFAININHVLNVLNIKF
jgi:hypothetical protein